MEKRIEALPAGASRLVLLSLTGLRLAKTRFNGKVQARLTGAFLKRLSAIVPAGAVIGRWSEEEFMIVLPTPQEAAAPTPNAFSEQLSGAYACLKDGKTVRPTLQVRAASLSPNQLSEIPRVTA
jgi:GGDEF domain-containing protein